MTLPRIVTVYDRDAPHQLSWCAYRDGWEERGHYGNGRTEAEAIADLLEIESWRAEAAATGPASAGATGGAGLTDPAPTNPEEPR